MSNFACAYIAIPNFAADQIVLLGLSVINLMTVVMSCVVCILSWDGRQIDSAMTCRATPLGLIWGLSSSGFVS